MSTNAISRRYAKALVQLAAEEGRVEKVQEELAAFLGAMSSSRELAALLKNPAFGIETKRGIVKDLVEKLSLSGIVGNVLLLLLDRNRIDALPQILQSYQAQADELSGVVRPVVTSALPLEAAQLDSLKGSLEKATGKKVALTMNVDPSILGGVMAKIGDRIFDGSVRTQLETIQDILQKG